MEAILAILTVALLVAALERHHRRTFHVPRTPLGADSEHDRDLARMLEDLTWAPDKGSS